jgi:hypothetical protein
VIDAATADGGMADLSTIQAMWLFLQAVIILLLGIGVKQLTKINGSVGKLNTWAELHQKQDDERHDIEVQDRRDLWSKFNNLKGEGGGQ